MQAASYIRKTGGSAEEYLTKLKSSDERQSRLLGKEFIDRHRKSETPNSVMQTWLISMEQMARESKDGETILRTAAFWDNQGLPFELLHAALGPDADEDTVTEAISRLEDFSFLQRRRTETRSSPTYDMHRLVQLAIRNSLDTSQKEFFSGCALRIIADIFPDGPYPVWDKCKMYFPHALKAVEWPEAENFRENVSKLLYNVSSFFYWQVSVAEEVLSLLNTALDITAIDASSRATDILHESFSHNSTEPAPYVKSGGEIYLAIEHIANQRKGSEPARV